MTMMTNMKLVQSDVALTHTNLLQGLISYTYIYFENTYTCMLEMMVQNIISLKLSSGGWGGGREVAQWLTNILLLLRTVPNT